MNHDLRQLIDQWTKLQYEDPRDPVDQQQQDVSQLLASAKELPLTDAHDVRVREALVWELELVLT